MSAAEEAARAAAYRVTKAAQIAAKAAAEARMVGDPAAAADVLDGWKALLPLDDFGVPMIGSE